MRIAWAFNPFDKNRKLRTRARLLLRSLEVFSSKPEFVFVSSPGETELALAFDLPERDRFTLYPRKLIKAAADEMGIKNAVPVVIPEKSLSLTAAAQGLTRYLSERNVGITLVATHARTGVSRFFMGSFAETLIHYSRSNLLLFNERTRVKTMPKRLLFSHDLSRTNDQGLREALKFAKEWGAELHAVYVPSIAYNFKSRKYAAEIAQYRRKVEKELEGVEKILRDSGNGGSLIIDDQSRPAAESILAHAKSLRADMVVVVAKTGRFLAVLGGSVTRDFVRSAPVPVLVMKS